MFFLVTKPLYVLQGFLFYHFFGLYIGFVINPFPPASSRQAILIDLLWVALTLIFEFGFSRYRGSSWPQLLEDYNLLKGRIWILILLWLAIAPYIFYKLR